MTTIQNRRDTAANWTSENPTLASGEMGYETDTGAFKFGDGTTAWNSLLYAVGKWQSWTPTWQAFTPGASTVSAIYLQQGPLVHLDVEVVLGSGFSFAGTGVGIVLPIEAASLPSPGAFGAVGLDQGAAYFAMMMAGGPDTTKTPLMEGVLASTTYAQWAQTSSTIPFTWVTGDVFKIAGWYRISYPT